MPAWIIKSETDDPDRALEIVADQRSRGYNAWIEDENGVAVDEQSLKINGRVPTTRTLSERLMGPLFIAASMLPVSLFFTWLVCGLTNSEATDAK